MPVILRSTRERMIGLKMMCKRFLLTTALVFVTFFLLRGPLHATGDDSWLAQGRDAYYELDAQGLNNFECVATLTPVVPEELPKLFPSDPRVLFRKGFRFAAMVDDRHQWTVTPYATTGEKTDFESSMTEGASMMVADALRSWGRFVLTNPFARFSQSTPIRDGLNSLHLSSNDHGSALELSMTDDYVITSVEETIKSIEFNTTSKKVTTKVTIITLHPTFIKTDKGLLLKSIDEDVSTEVERPNIVFEYGALNGWALPTKVRIGSKVSGQTLNFEIAFSNYKTNSARKSPKH